MEPADVHLPRHAHRLVLGRVQAHGDGPRTRHRDPLEEAMHVLSVKLQGAARGKPRAAAFRTSGGGAAPNIKASITTRAADVHGRC